MRVRRVPWAPNWNDPVAISGNGFYSGTVVSVTCYEVGTTVPASSNTMWVEASWVSGPGGGSGWMNEHFVNDGALINQAAPGIPACDTLSSTPVSAPAPAPASAPSSILTPTPLPSTTSNSQRAISWATSRLGLRPWDGYCLAFFYQAFLRGAGVNITAGLPNGPVHNSAYTY